MTIDGDWLERRRAALARTKLSPIAEAQGRVERIADGVAHVSGLEEARLNEILRFEGGEIGFALTLEEGHIATVLLDEADGIEAGARVAASGEVVDTPVGEALLGRVLDPLGRALDGGPAITAAKRSPIEQAAPAIVERALVSEPLETGILAIDSMFALGRGQRELIIGDRATGKTAIAIDTIIQQKRRDVICVYVAIGQRVQSSARIQAVCDHGAPKRCIFVVAGAAAPAGLQWIAPFAGITIAEYFRDRGGHALIVIDDLTKHAATHRELALLTRQPPGREAYPGDVFYLHARLLERAAKLSQARGGGSLTALPIAETDAGNLAAYIPTNLISITDGQIVLDARLFARTRGPPSTSGLTSAASAARRRRERARRRGQPQARIRAVPGTRTVHPFRRPHRSARARPDHARPAHSRPDRPTEVRRPAPHRSGRADRRAGSGRIRSAADRRADRDPRRNWPCARRRGRGRGAGGRARRSPQRGLPEKAGRDRRPRRQGPLAMTERLADVSRRIGSVGQLAAVIGAMRAMAAARSRDARARLDGVRAYERAVAEAIGQALAMTPEDGAVSALDGASGSHAIVAFTAEQGFAGPFNTRVLDAAQRLSEQARPRRVQLLLLGGRGLLAARQRDIEIAWSHAMIAHLDQAPALADAIQGQLFEGLGSGVDRARHRSLCCAGGIGRDRDRRTHAGAVRFHEISGALRSRAPPLTTMAPAALLARLADEYVFGRSTRR